MTAAAPAPQPGADTTTALAPEGPTAFRVEEKRYQLHREQHVRYRQGKARGAKYVTRPTDLSDVVDLHTNTSHPAAVPVTWSAAKCRRCSQQQGQQQQHQEQPRPQQQQQEHQHQQEKEEQQQQQLNPLQQQLLCTCRSFTFPAHPGLLYLPTAIPASLQLHLISQALEQYPEPPARTNHWRAYGPLPGIFTAAQQGLHCAVTPVPLDGDAGGMYSSSGHSTNGHSTAAPAVAAAAEAAAVAQAAADSQQQPLQATKQQHGCQCHQNNNDHQQQQQQQQRMPTSCQCSSAQHPSPQQPEHHPSQRTFHDAWCSGGRGTEASQLLRKGMETAQRLPKGTEAAQLLPKGAEASQLLRKLRWACLGPRFDWTARLYDGAAEHRPLPAVLRAIAVEAAAAAVDAAAVAGAAVAGAAVARAAVDGSAIAAAVDRAAYVKQRAAGAPAAGEAAAGAAVAGAAAADMAVAGAAACPAIASDDAGHAASGAAAVVTGATAPAAAVPAARGVTTTTATSPPKPHNPDAAIINYYYTGDTLGGHQDNVEKDGSQPIISISLGCDAVFLMGGPSKEQRPTALLLKSGDILVMGGASRGCYHGVPRVLTERGLPEELLAAAGMAGMAELGAAAAGAAAAAGTAGTAAGKVATAGPVTGVTGQEQQQLWSRAHVMHMRDARINISIRSTGWDE